ncbi:hypothetical protein EYC98_17450 [Halieaceae bacterium IMCC14734]|uniref:Lipoprotein n=1 Tax=Candidatus Litorirhabdus singularis TaxID=2518993 RepID=A0ABT3TK94_9GAMM|nr:hypothetical protein [Candidatus Litorirhabdus singularis]MCX2982650.1 hypothetical protein [Candidatus Litorirhabdus singularis]
MSVANRYSRLLLLLALTLTTSGCVNQTIKSTTVPDVNTSAREVPEALLLDVGISIFDPGLDDADEDELVYPEVRRAEARYMPYILLESIQSSAAWGAVRVIPSDQQVMDIVVAGTIVSSSGEELELKIIARDARGEVWLDKGYRSKASKYSYGATTRARIDPFQAIYNRIANDLLEQLLKRNTEELAAIRTVNELRFARSMSPDAFDGHLSEDGDGTYSITRLPANNDPMLERVRKIRERDHLFIDTMQEYYSAFNGQMSAPYQEWRKLSYTEAIALQELRAEATRKLITGAALVIAGIAAGASNDSSINSASTVAILGGGSIFKSGMDARTESEIHVQALEELGLSLEAEIAPQIIELEDRTVTLTGNVQDQFDQWRDLLRQLYEAEVGALEPLPTPVGS